MSECEELKIAGVLFGNGEIMATPKAQLRTPDEEQGILLWGFCLGLSASENVGAVRALDALLDVR